MSNKNRFQMAGAIIIAILIFSMSSCNVFHKLQAPKYNAASYQLAVTADSTINYLYSGFQNGVGLDYNSSTSIYDFAANVVNEKIVIDSSRKYPTQILKIDKIYLDILESARQDHQHDGNISGNHINVNGALLKQIGNILVNTEKTYK